MPVPGQPFYAPKECFISYSGLINLFFLYIYFLIIFALPRRTTSFSPQLWTDLWITGIIQSFEIKGFWRKKKLFWKERSRLLLLEISGDLQGCLVPSLNWNWKYFHHSLLWRIPELIDSGNTCVLSQILNLCYVQRALSILRRGNSSL